MENDNQFAPPQAPLPLANTAPHEVPQAVNQTSDALPPEEPASLGRKKISLPHWSKIIILFLILIDIGLVFYVAGRNTGILAISINAKPTATPTKPSPAVTPTAAPTGTPAPTKAAVKAPVKPPTVSLQSSGTLPSGQGKISVIYYTGDDKGQGSKQFSPPGAIVTLKHQGSGYTKSYTDAPTFMIPNLPPGSYTFTVSNTPNYDVRYSTNVSDYNSGTSIRSEVKPGSSATLTLQDGGFASVSFGFTPKTGSAQSSDSSLPEITAVDAPVNIFNANTDHTINQRSFCITLHVKDNISTEAKIDTQVKLLNLGNVTYVFDSGWTNLKQHCFSNLQNNEYQVEMNVRDEVGNVGKYGTNIRILSS